MVMGVIWMMEMVIWLCQMLFPIAVASLLSFDIFTSFVKGLGLIFFSFKGVVKHSYQMFFSIPLFLAAAFVRASEAGLMLIFLNKYERRHHKCDVQHLILSLPLYFSHCYVVALRLYNGSFSRVWNQSGVGFNYGNNWSQQRSTQIDSAFAVNQGHVNIKDKMMTTTDQSKNHTSIKS